MTKISVVIPVFNEEKAIANVVREVKEVLKRVRYKTELIVVDDGSTDDTSKQAKNAAKDIILIKHPYNKGYGAALKTGALNAKGEFVLYIDGDGQHYAQDIIKIANYINDYDMIIGSRTTVTSIFRLPGKIILSWLANYIAETKIPDLNSGFRAIKRELIMKYLDILPNKFSFTTTITLASLKGGYNIKYVDIKMKPRKLGKSSLKPFKDGARFIMLILRMSMLFGPLRIFVPISIIFMATGFAYALVGIIKFLKIPQISAILILSGVMIFFFGLLADQIAMLRRM